MNRPPAWMLALIFSLSGISVFGLLCLTAVHFQGGNFRIYFEGPGGLKIDAGVDKGQVAEENKQSSFSEVEKTDRCFLQDGVIPSEPN